MAYPRLELEREISSLQKELVAVEYNLYSRSACPMGMPEREGWEARERELHEEIREAREQVEEWNSACEGSEPGDASVRGETSDGCCAFCGKPVDSPQCCVNPR